MRLIAVTQRVDTVLTGSGGVERRDGLDQAWIPFMAAAGCLPLLMPNHAPTALTLLDDLPVQGLLLTGGNDLAAYGGDAPERDAAEFALLAAARVLRLPVIGVCRGMQVVQQAFGVPLQPLEGHVAAHQEVEVNGRLEPVNSYHRWGARGTAPQLAVWARSGDGVVKAVRHLREPILGLMWHPERVSPFAERDVALFRQVFERRTEIAA
jgi:gamma-glutamyl-gamma-aminobutyrate hydrolase PuuD